MVTARFAGLSDIGHECTAKEHHASAEQPLTYVTFSQEEPGPQDGKESAELEERRTRVAQEVLVQNGQERG